MDIFESALTAARYNHLVVIHEADSTHGGVAIDFVM